jgi:hypothetical protein
MEFIKHFFGLCGESHLNIYSVIFIIMLILAIKYKLRTNE